jgi:hypothetical protein
MEEEHKKYLEYAKKVPVTEEFPFDLISKRISILLQAGEILDNHIEEFEASLKKVLKESKIPPSSAIIYDYILLNINLFYEEAELRKINVQLPPTRNSVERFRHNLLGHFQREDNIGITQEYEIINQDGFLKIYNEWLEFRDKVFSSLNRK